MITLNQIRKTPLTESGGSSDMRVDGSVTPVEFSITAAPGTILQAVSLRFFLNLDDPPASLNHTGFGASAAPLTNGIDVYIHDSSNDSAVSLTGNVPIRRTVDFVRFCRELNSIAVGTIGSGETVISGDIFAAEAERYIVRPHESIKVIIRDDLTDNAYGLEDLSFLATHIKVG
jgi:hypothetical protein